jgi:hypothetical protein
MTVKDKGRMATRTKKWQRSLLTTPKLTKNERSLVLLKGRKCSGPGCPDYLPRGGRLTQAKILCTKCEMKNKKPLRKLKAEDVRLLKLI